MRWARPSGKPLLMALALIVGVGAGFSYEDSGPTHHAIEDLAIMRILPNMTVMNCSSNRMAVRAAGTGGGLKYVRLDRQELPDIHTGLVGALGADDQFTIWGKGIMQHRSHAGDLAVITTGNMVHRVLDAIHPDEPVSVIEVWKFPFDGACLNGMIGAKHIRICEENNDQGGLSAAIWESVKRDTLNGVNLRSNGYGYHYTRDAIHEHYSLDVKGIRSWLGLD